MSEKNYQITQLQSDGSLLILHPETSADVIKETTTKKVMTSDERTKLSNIASGAQVNVIESIKVNDVTITPDSNKAVNITAEPSGSVSTHNSSSTAHTDIRNLVSTAQTTADNAQTKADSAYVLAEGRARAVSFDTLSAMTSALKSAAKTDYKIGDNLFIKAVGVPDYWISNVLSTNTGTYGYFEISELETQKVDLSSYYTKTESDNKYLTKTDAANTYATTSTVNALSSTVSNNTTNINSVTTDIANIKSGTTKVGKASTADSLSTSRTFTYTNDATGSGSFNGSANVTVSLTLKDVGTAGTYSVISTDSKGRVTAGAQLIEVGSTNQTVPSSTLAVGGIFYKQI